VASSDRPPTQIHVVLNWFGELDQLAPRRR